MSNSSSLLRWSLFFEALGAIAAAFSLVQLQQCSSPSRDAIPAQQIREVRVMNEDSARQVFARKLNDQIRSSSGYEIVYVLGEGDGFVDLRTSFAFKTIDIARTGGWSGDRPNWADGVLSNFQHPDGTRGDTHRRAKGERIDFKLNGRSYFAAIENIDYDHKWVVIRIKELSFNPGMGEKSGQVLIRRPPSYLTV